MGRPSARMTALPTAPAQTYERRGAGSGLASGQFPDKMKPMKWSLGVMFRGMVEGEGGRGEITF